MRLISYSTNLFCLHRWLPLLALSFALQLSAAPDLTPNWAHDSWTIADGLPVNAIIDIAQDKHGYVWLTTYDGLVRFDGVRFKVFNTSSHPNLPSNRFIKITIDAQDNYWINTEQAHLIRFDGQDFETMTTAHGLPGNSVYGMTLADDGSMLFPTDAGVARYRDHQFEIISPPIPGISNNVHLSKDGSLWLATDQGAIQVSNGEIVLSLTEADGLPSDIVLTTYATDDGVWISTAAGLAYWQAERLHQVPVLNHEIDGPVHRYDPVGDTLWMTTGDGVFGVRQGQISHRPTSKEQYKNLSPAAWLDKDQNLWRTSSNNFLKNEQIVFESSEVFNRVLYDQEGSIWFTTDKGLHRIRLSPFQSFGVRQGLPSENTYPVLQHSSGNIWFGTLAGDLYELDPDSGKITIHDDKSAGDIWTLHEQADGRIWVGGSDICLYDGRACAAVNAPEKLSVKSIVSDSSGAIWFGSRAGLYQFKDGLWTKFDNADGLSRHFVRTIVESNDGSLWMATNGAGLWKYSGHRFETYNKAAGLCSDLIRAIHLQDDGSLLLGTEDRGLCHVRLDKGSIVQQTPIEQTHGLPDYSVNSILTDSLGNYWFSSNRGIYTIKKHDLMAFLQGHSGQLQPVVYTERNGLPISETNGGMQPSGIRSRDGRLWFPTQAGLVVIDPEQLDELPVLPAVVIEQVSIGSGEQRQLLKLTGINQTTQIETKQQQLDIEYTSPSFIDSAVIRFRYQLQGFDNDWVNADTRRQTTYTNLPPGNYRFRVSAASADGNWNSPTETLAVTILARWYQTTWFYALCAVLLVALGLLIGQWRRRQLHLHRRELEGQVAERTSELQSALQTVAEQTESLQELDKIKSQFFANISHEFRTPLAVIMGTLQENLDGQFGSLTPDMLERNLAMMRNSQRLQTLIEQVLDLNKLESGRLELDNQPGCVVQFLQRLLETYMPMAERKQIKLQFMHEQNNYFRLFDADKLEKIIGNILSNAIKFTPEGGSVWMQLEVPMQSPDTPSDRATDRTGTQPISITITDTGPGIPVADQQRVFERFVRIGDTSEHEGTGIGLSLAKELAQLYGGDICIQSQPDQGTNVIVQLPLELSQKPIATDQLSTVSTSKSAISATNVKNTASFKSDDHDDAIDQTTLLVIEDNDDVRAFIRRNLVHEYRVLEADNGKLGLQMATEKLPDLVISDVMLPGMDGFAIAHQIKQHKEAASIPIIMLTARAADSDQTSGYQSGAEVYLTKPFSPATLKAAVNRLLTERQRLRQQLIEKSTASLAESIQTDPHSSLVDQLRLLLAKHSHHQSLNLDEIADQLNMSRRTLFRKIKQETDQTPDKFIKQLRLEQARELLERDAGNISEVAYAVGFNSLEHFTRSFKEHFKHSPSSIR